MLWTDIVVISSVDLCKEVLSTQDQIFCSRPPNIQGEVLFYNNQDLFFVPMSDGVRLRRKLCLTEMFNSTRLQHFRNVRKEEVVGAIDRIQQGGVDGKPVNIDRILTEMRFNNITRTMFGRTFFGRKITTSADKLEMEEFQNLFKEYSTIGTYFLGDFIPWLRRLDVGGGEAKLRRLFVRFDNFLSRLVKERRALERSHESTDGNTYLDILLQLQSEDVKKEQHLSEYAIKALILDMLLAGVLTTSGTVLWTIAEVMRHPEVLKKIQMELDSEVGQDRLVDEADLTKLPYMRAVVKESLRLHPLVPIHFRYSSKSTKVGGYDIPENTPVWVNMYAIHRDPSVWPNPLEFDPERFLVRPIEGKGNHFEYLPFGAGRRICVGMNVGIVLSELTFAQILHTCILDLPHGMKPEDVNLEDKLGSLLEMVEPVQVLFRPRLSPEVYKEAGVKSA